METSDFPNPRFEAQMEGEGYPDALDLMRMVSKLVPVYALRDTLTKRYVVVFPARPTGDEHVVWTQDPVDGQRKFNVASLVAPRFQPTKDVKLSHEAGVIVQVQGDSPLYQRERSRDEV